jgi:hypothetical protein
MPSWNAWGKLWWSTTLCLAITHRTTKYGHIADAKVSAKPPNPGVVNDNKT